MRDDQPTRTRSASLKPGDVPDKKTAENTQKHGLRARQRRRQTWKGTLPPCDGEGFERNAKINQSAKRPARKDTGGEKKNKSLNNQNSKRWVVTTSSSCVSWSRLLVGSPFCLELGRARLFFFFSCFLSQTALAPLGAYPGRWVAPQPTGQG